MTNLCTKVTVRKRPIKNGQTSLYQPEDWPSVTARVSGILHLHEPDGEVPGGV